LFRFFNESSLYILIPEELESCRKEPGQERMYIWTRQSSDILTLPINGWVQQVTRRLAKEERAIFFQLELGQC